MQQEITYREYATPATLDRQIVCAWHLAGSAVPGQVDTVYPDGCCEIIVHLGRPPKIRGDSGRWVQQTQCLFASQHRSALQMAWQEEVDCIGVRLQPAASSLLTGPAVFEMKDQVADLHALDPIFASFFQTCVQENTKITRDHPVWKLLATRLPASGLDPVVESAVNTLSASQGDCSIKSLASELNLGLRAFQTRFRQAVGLSPKEFARVMRLQTTLRMLDDKEVSLAELALDGGFSDQAHASRELRRMTGLTPARLRRALNSDRAGGETIRMAAAFVRGS